jgi:hypothetical protein
MTTTKKTGSKKEKPSTIKQKVVRLGSKKSAARRFECPGDCKSLVVAAKATGSKLVVVI